MAKSLLTILHVLLTFAINTHLISCSQEFETVQTAWFETQNALEWAKSTKKSVDQSDHSGSSYASVALGECVRLYGSSEERLSRLVSGDDYSRDDAVTWLSAALASNRGCLDGLKEKGLSFDTKTVRKLTLLLGEALVSKKEQNDTRATINGVPSSDGDWGLLESWNSENPNAHVFVAQDGTGNYKTINEALNTVAAWGSTRPERTVIYVKSGIYNEQVIIGSKLKNLMFVGDGIGRTIVTGNKNFVDGWTTLASATFSVYGDGFWARDMTFENTAGPIKQQAVALSVQSDQSIFYRCSFRAYQDTLLVYQNRQFYRDCQIHGTIDFIFGDASAVFQNCDIFVRLPLSYQENMITAQGRENPHTNTGISIVDSRVVPDSDFALFKWSIRSYLGRPWRQYSRVAFIRTRLDDLVAPEGWAKWNGEDFGLSTLYYAECMNTGKGADTSNRVKWPGFHAFQDPDNVGAFSARNLIQGDLWIPASGVPFSANI